MIPLRSESAGPHPQKTKRTVASFFMPRAGSDPWITFTVLLLMCFGSLMVVSTSLGTAVGASRQIYVEILKQAIYGGIAWEVGMVAASHWFSYKLARPLQGFLVVVYILVLILTMVIGTDANGSRAWIQIGSIASVQPSEFGKLLLIVTLALSAGSIKNRPQERQSFWRVFAWPLVLMAVSVIFVGGAQKDFGSLIITLGIGLTGMLIPSWKTLRKWQRILFCLLLAGAVLFMTAAYFNTDLVEWMRSAPLVRHIAVRIDNMHNPYLTIHGEGYQPANALYGIADAGLFGRGLGSSIRKYGFLTQADSDYILAIVIEETGCIGLGIITIGYGILLWRLLYWALEARDLSDKVLLTCGATYFMLHFFINIGGVITLIPMTGVPLLLISAGGTAQITACMIIGVMQARISALRQAQAKQ